MQTAAIQAKATAAGVAVEMFEPELDVSGSKRSRAVLDAILERIEAGELAGIVVYNLSRLSRLAPRDRIELVERIERAGGIILSASESFDASTPEGRFQRDLFFSIARMQWEQAAETFAVSKANAIEAGRPVKAVAPFGYKRRQRGGGVLELEPADAAIVVELFERRLEGDSLSVLAEWFSARVGRQTPASTVSSMLENRTYIGELHYGRRDDTRVVGSHEAPIVDVSLFESVQEVNARRSSGRGVAVNRAKSLLAGIARCEACGRGLVCTRTGSARTLSYKCPATSRLCGERAQVPAELLDRFVEDAVLAWIGPDADVVVELELELGARAGRIVVEHRLGEARRVLVDYEADVERELEVGREAYAAGRRARVELELEELGEADELEVVRSTLRDALRAGGGLEVDERRRLYSVALERVDVRRAPRGTAASERATLTFAGATESSLSEDGAELGEEVAA